MMLESLRSTSASPLEPGARDLEYRAESRPDTLRATAPKATTHQPPLTML